MVSLATALSLPSILYTTDGVLKRGLSSGFGTALLWHFSNDRDIHCKSGLLTEVYYRFNHMLNVSFGFLCLM
ncbi:hypothetical protein GGR51DRAFT_530655 [Nemania sp. FL0031]|nr:hypothetical protein GGR51DRAFT_530655 [Nemania sp. FL0031]